MSILQHTRTDLPAGTWKLDSVHSSIGFSVKHMLVANFRGGFSTFDVTLDSEGLRGTVDVSSVDVSEPNLNGHLLAPDFFDAERHPQLAFPLDGGPRRRRRHRVLRRPDDQGRDETGDDQGHAQRARHAPVRRQ